MTTKDSPPEQVKSQTDRIARVLKRAEKGYKIDVQFAEKIREARKKDSFTVGIVMDDKVLKVDISWTTIRETQESDLSDWICNQMREIKPS